MRKQQRQNLRERRWHKRIRQQRLEDSLLGETSIWAEPEEIARSLRDRRMATYYDGGFKIHWNIETPPASPLAAPTGHDQGKPLGSTSSRLIVAPEAIVSVYGGGAS